MNDTQKKLVLEHMRTHDGITSMDAIMLYGITRLAHVVYMLKKQGYDVRTVKMHGFNRQGTPTIYAKYVLVEEK